MLIEQRTRQGHTTADLARAGRMRFTASFLDDVERGRVDVTDVQAQELLELYGLELDGGAANRSQLIVELSEGTVGVGPTALRFDERTGPVVLERYISLLYLLRGQTPGSPVPLRNDDLDVLATALDASTVSIESDLRSIIADRFTPSRTRRLGRRTRIAQLGLLVGATVTGALIIVGDPGASAEAASPVSTSNAPVQLASVRLDKGAVTISPAEVGVLAEALIDFDLVAELPGWTIDYRADHDIYAGLTNSVHRRIVVHVAPEQSPREVAEVLMHEVGHAIDLDRLDDGQRAVWLAMRGIDGPWWTESGAEDFHVGAGDFAEAVAAVTIGSASHSAHGPFTSDQLDFVADVLAARPASSQLEGTL